MTSSTLSRPPTLVPAPLTAPVRARAGSARPPRERLAIRRFIRWVVVLLVRLSFRVRAVGPHALPTEGPAIVVANHVSYADSLILAALCPQPMRFAYWHGFDRVLFVGVLFRFMGGVPIASRSESAAVHDAAIDELARSLAAGEVIGIFPEGTLTRDGEIGAFKSGLERVLARHPAPVVPVGLRGLWGSVLSRAPRAPFRLRLPARRAVELEVGRTVVAREASAPLLRQRVAALRGDHP